MLHKRKNIRLKGYDYSRAGLYFLTIVIQRRWYLFGRIENGEMILNDAGRMIEKWYHEIEHKYPDKRCREMVVMPNHFHCIIEIVEHNADAQLLDTQLSGEQLSGEQSSGAHVGAPLRGRSDKIDNADKIDNFDNNVITQIETTECTATNESIIHFTTDDKYGIHNKKYGATIGDVMDWFKTMTTNAYIRGVKEMNWRRYDAKLWQRNYYDHIIRDWEDDIRISNYIAENPRKWHEDKFYKMEE